MLSPADLLAAVRTVDSFPEPGVSFKDLGPLLADPALARDTVEYLARPFLTAGVTHIVGVDARGFWFGPSLALRLGAAFVPARKPGKLPPPTARVDYALEYGTDALELADGALRPGDRVVLHDDVLATGGTAAAAAELVAATGADLLGVSVVLELAFLDGRRRLDGQSVHAVAAVDG